MGAVLVRRRFSKASESLQGRFGVQAGLCCVVVEVEVAPCTCSAIVV